MKPRSIIAVVAIALMTVLEVQTGTASAEPAPSTLTASQTANDSVAARQSRLQKKDVPYVPTMTDTVDLMLRMAKVSSDDVVFDLGSGDGRIVIAAALDYGARGVGIDIDPVRVFEAEENAKEAGVSNRVEFIEGDLFEADLSEATVVTLYLLPSVNLKLRPKLLRELKPGTPVVSHDFSMGDWEPEDTQDIGEDRVFLWIIPPYLEGQWRWNDSGLDHVASFDQDIRKLGGQIRAGKDVGTIRNGRLEGDEVSFEVVRRGATGTSLKWYRGRVHGNRIEGTVESAGRTERWIASR